MCLDPCRNEHGWSWVKKRLGTGISVEFSYVHPEPLGGVVLHLMVEVKKEVSTSQAEMVGMGENLAEQAGQACFHALGSSCVEISHQLMSKPPASFHKDIPPSVCT